MRLEEQKEAVEESGLKVVEIEWDIKVYNGRWTGLLC